MNENVTSVEAKKAVWQNCFFGVPGMGDNSVVKVHYALGSRKR